MTKRRHRYLRKIYLWLFIVLLEMSLGQRLGEGRGLVEFERLKMKYDVNLPDKIPVVY